MVTESAFNAIFGAIENCPPGITMGDFAGSRTRYIRNVEDVELANSILGDITGEVVEGVKEIVVGEAAGVIRDSSLGLVRDVASHASRNSGELSQDLSDLIIRTPMNTPLEALITTVNTQYLDGVVSVAAYDAAGASILF